MQVATIEYWICDYHGEVKVYCGEDEENEKLFARAEHILKNGSEFPVGYRSFKIISRIAI